MTNRQRSWLLPPAALALVAGVFLGRNAAGILLPLFACILTLSSVFFLKGWLRFSACIVFSVMLGLFAGSLAFHPDLPPEGEYNIQGVISDEVTNGSFGQYRIALSDVTLDGRPLSGGAYWTFYSDEDHSSLLPGKAVSFTASLYHPRGADNPDGYDFREALLQSGITVGVYGKDSLTVQDPVCFSFAGFIASLRHRLSASLIAALGEETGAYASAMLLGMRSLIPSDDRQAFSRLGIAHILSVSGFHVGVLIGILNLLFHLLRLRQSVRLLLYAVLLFFYSSLCGMSQPVIRASLLMLLGLEGRILNRPRSGLHLLSAVLFIMVLFSPVQVTSASFQLTFCSVFGLVWVMPFIRRRKRFRSRILQYVFESLVLTFGIQLGLLLPELSFFQRLPLLVFLVNLPAMLISGMLILFFWLALLCLPVPFLSALLSVPLSSVTGFLLSGIRQLGALPGLTLWIHVPNLLTVFGVVLLFLGFCCFIRFHAGMRTGMLVLGAVLVVVSLFPAHHNGTEYIQLSAGNADAAVIWDQDKVYVMDTGEDDGTLSSFLRARRLTPDAVILTHLHTDHAGGLRSLIEDEIPVNTILLPEGAEAQDIHPEFIALLDQLQQSGTEIRSLSRGDVLPLPSGILTVLWPEHGKVRSGQDANKYSLVTRLTLKESTVLLAADLPGAYEQYCAAPSDLLKAAHHGSPSSSSPDFISAVSPKAILLSCRQPARVADFRSRSGDIPVYGTPEYGALTVRFEEDKFTVIPYLTP